MTRHYETYNRKRNIFCGFRLSSEEKERLKKYVAMSGMTERDYISQRALQEEVVVAGNTRVFKALKDQFEEIIKELKRMPDKYIPPFTMTDEITNLVIEIAELTGAMSAPSSGNRCDIQKSLILKAFLMV